MVRDLLTCLIDFAWKRSEWLFSLNASDFRRPRVQIFASDKPLSTASKAASIRKLAWPLYRLISRPQNFKHRESSLLN